MEKPARNVALGGDPVQDEPLHSNIFYMIAHLSQLSAFWVAGFMGPRTSQRELALSFPRNNAPGPV